MDTEPDISAILQDALQAHETGRLPEADALYARILHFEPEHLQAMRLHGIVARERGDVGASRRILSHAVKLAPDDAEILGELALSCMAAGLLTEATAGDGQKA